MLDDYPRSIDEAIDKSGLGWGVRAAPVNFERRPAWTDDLGAKHPPELERARSHKATLRSDTGDLLGIVGADHPPLDNRDAFRFLNELIGSQLHFETAGSLWGGRRVWVLARLPEWVEVGQPVGVEHIPMRSERRPLRGDEAELFRLHYKRLVRQVQRDAGVPEPVAEDCASFAFLQRCRNQPERGHATAARLRVVARHDAFAWLRQRRGLRVLDEEDGWSRPTLDRMAVGPV